MNSNPTGFAAVVSFTVKAVLAALVATGILGWDEATTSTVALAVAAVVDLAIMLGIVRPRTIPIGNPIPGPSPDA